LLYSVSACNKGSNPQGGVVLNKKELDPWLKQLIAEIKQKEPTNPPAKIYRYTYNG
jgi:hypothetical protein